jgi:sialate O-acetylesterase
MLIIRFRHKDSAFLFDATSMNAADICRTLPSWLRSSLGVPAVLFLLVHIALADPTLPTLITDHMVLQQGRPIHIWGWADAGEKITVMLAGNTNSATTDSTGHWSVNLPAMSAGGPLTMQVQGKKEIVIKDVLIGEVWVASGQSNMTFGLEGATGAGDEIPKANFPEIRLFTVPKRIALTPQENTLVASWQICTSDTAKSFSAVAYFFARALHENLHVPIGIIHSSWPGTPAELWTDVSYLQRDPEIKPIWDEWNSQSVDVKAFAERPAKFDLEFDDFELLYDPASSLPPLSLANFDDGTLRNVYGGESSYTWQSAPNTTFDLVSPGRGGHGFAVRIAGTLDGAEDSSWTTHFRLDNSAVDLSAFAGIRFWVRGTGDFRLKTHQPTITDWDDYGVDIMKASPDWQPITIWFRDLKQEDWGVRNAFTQDAITGFHIENLTPLGYAPIPPSGLFAGMIAPLTPYPFRGVIWYQGESNTLKAHQYRKLLPAMIESWRAATHQPAMDFLIVQLANHGAIPTQPVESAWAEMREAELFTMKSVSHTGLAVTIDVGDPRDIHPHHKREVGERLALVAEGTTYGEPIQYSGPLYQSMKIEGSRIRIHFTQLGHGLEVRGGGPLQGFAIAGADKKFRWADARIDGDAVVVSNPETAAPVAVRYAWADSPPCNLFNKDGLPASPFRTDDWPGITAGK